MTYTVVQGDCIPVMLNMGEASVDAIVADPPYGLEFMGKEWDHLPSPVAAQAWHTEWAIAALHILRPGGHLLAFGGTRTYHRLACALEDAGFEIRDCLCWLYGSGFPKSLDVSKAIDKAAGAEREVVGSQRMTGTARRGADGSLRGPARTNTAEPQERAETIIDLTAPATPDAQRWQGWGTALKPAWEPIILARKPIGKSVTENVLQHGTGVLNVDGCRITAEAPLVRPAIARHDNTAYGEGLGAGVQVEPSGRWPANVTLSHTEDCVRVSKQKAWTGTERPTKVFGARIVEHEEESGVWDCSPECPVRMLNEQSGDVGNQWKTNYGERYADEQRQYGGGTFGGGAFKGNSTYVDNGGASRFFYCAKTSSAERNAGLDTERNVHPTVKPIDLMRWLVRLITPPEGLVLDPFLGSGTTAIAAMLEGFDCVGVEREPDYVQIAKARIKWWEEHRELPKPKPVPKQRTGQMDFTDVFWGT